jgi:hypothetical protein
MRSTGRMKRSSPTPALNQMAISLSRYIRPRLSTTATNSDSASISGSWPAALKPSTRATSCGDTEPLAARPRVRISIMVITMVRMTTRVAPKLRASSLRTDESNNIKSSFQSRRIMNFQALAATAEGLAAVAADTLIAVLPAEGTLKTAMPPWTRCWHRWPSKAISSARPVAPCT